jgi:hypothetical protein
MNKKKSVNMLNFKKFCDKNKLFESSDKWLSILQKSYEDFQYSENYFNNPDNDWLDSEKWWIFEKPIHILMKELGILEVFDGIVKYAESHNFNQKDMLIEHYMMNDFTVGWKDAFEVEKTIEARQNMSFSFEAIFSYPPDENNVKAITSDQLKHYTAYNRQPSSDIDNYVAASFDGHPNKKEMKWELRNMADVADMMMDLYDIGDLGPRL